MSLEGPGSESSEIFGASTSMAMLLSSVVEHGLGSGVRPKIFATFSLLKSNALAVSSSSRISFETFVLTAFFVLSTVSTIYKTSAYVNESSLVTF